MNRNGLILAALAVIAIGLFLESRVTRLSSTRAAKGNKEITSSSVDFTVQDLENHEVSLSRFKGKVVLVNFWATWCGPCNIEIPWLTDLQNKYREQGFTVLGVAMDEEGRSAVTPFVQAKRFRVCGAAQSMNYPIVLGNDATAAKFGGLIGLPTSVLISQDGRVVKRVDGLVSYDEIEKAIQSQLAAHKNAVP
jgi:cytochrome c biogenesis protein CcmG/thiol:disulfide interchange protein DsbE